MLSDALQRGNERSTGLWRGWGGQESGGRV